MNGKWKLLALAALIAGCFANAQAAGNITKIEPNTATAVLQDGKATVKFTVSGTAEEGDNCGIYIEYGDGDSPDTRIINQKEGLFPRTFDHTFTKPGGFSVKANGQRVRQTFGCNGSASTFVTITAPAAQKAAAAAKAAEAAQKGAAAGKAAPAAPACPDGWQLASYNRNSGEFSCSAKAPAAKLACGPGTAYFEKGGTIGCRRGK
ncbi:MAG: hypothetical protein A3H35_14505 [Betaproteobacteria bacterium RIFCSPLOWO2_02_FULL_62_17]|nr:MAG: hypothetical protein A3H35_14505 [Betaproteobacteria bacterium RIFCSPLOWO2_02_FULL_62_17]